MIGPALRRVVDAIAALYAVPSWTWAGELYMPGEVLEAHVMTESSGNPRARHADIPADLDVYGTTEDSASYGLLQVEGSTFKARLGAQSVVDFSVLYDPAVGLGAGLLEMRDWRNRVYSRNPGASENEILTRAFACYNAGGHGDEIDPATGRMRNAAYVERVGTSAKQVRAARLAVGWRAA